MDLLKASAIVGLGHIPAALVPLVWDVDLEKSLFKRRMKGQRWMRILKKLMFSAQS